ncbi:MAG TPA: nucleoside deaminase [Saprospiraceae bacterium]|nr:nucleoside deaminase [Saprospiraceae bacterium]
MTEDQKQYMMEAIRLSSEGMKSNDGGPFGCVIVKDGEIIGRGNNKVTSTNDPTAHAEIIAIRNACDQLHTYELDDCELYTSCEPCPMCLGAIYWAHLKKIYFACSRFDASDIGFDDDFIYSELKKGIVDRTIPMEQLLRTEALDVFKEWTLKEDKTDY